MNTKKSVLESFRKVLPYKLTKKIEKTAEARSGDKIYKRRNRRSARVLMKYSTWNDLKNNEDGDKTLKSYLEGFIVWLSPFEYFGENYPNKSNSLNQDFVLGKTGFVYYKYPEEFNDYKPLPEWKELFELSTNSGDKRKKTWSGDYCLNIRNTNIPRVSYICSDKHTKNQKDDLKRQLIKRGVKVDNYDPLPDQCGIGNYDYDYANEKMIKDVKLQMLYLMLTCEDPDGLKFADYIKNNIESIKQTKGKAHDTKTFIKSVGDDKYIKKYKMFFASLEKECKARRLIDYEKLMEINAWSPSLKRPTCPLCCQPINCEDFFKEVKQQEGREVEDNTQREVVLMHVNALRPKAFNHKTFNLAWGHLYCNTIQGDKDIDIVIKELKRIVLNHEGNKKEEE